MALLVAPGVHQGNTASGTNLLVNPSFESDLTGWTVVSSTPTVLTYGSANVPGSACGDHIGGDFKLLRDLGGNAVVEQIVPVGAVPPGTNLRVGGYFGGLQGDGARLVVRFLNSSLAEIARRNLDSVSATHRNSEAVLMLRQELLAIPAGTTSIAARVEFLEDGFSSRVGAADALFLELVSAPLTPAPLPLGENLLNNPGFEEGWTSSSPLSLVDPRGWYGADDSSVIVKPYTGADPFVPNEEVSCIVSGGEAETSCSFGGAGKLLSDVGGGGILRQRLDLRGNAAGIAAGLEVHVSALLGGYSSDGDAARVDVRFLRANLNLIGTVVALGSVTTEQRHSETVVVQRERVLSVPGDTGYIEVDVSFFSNGFSGVRGLADNLSLVLREPTTVPEVPLNSELMSNGGFENGSRAGSPLELTNPSGWFGTTLDTTEVPAYGTTNVPTLAFAQANGLGDLLLGDLGGNAGLGRVIDLTGSQDAIEQGRYSVYAEAWLGGMGTSTDSARLQIVFRTTAGAQVGPLHILGPVTPQERGNATILLRRSSEFAIPVGADLIDVQLLFNDDGFGLALGLADGIRVVVYDAISGGPLLHPGSRGDLRLLSGVNAPPTTGPGQDVKTALPHDTLNVRVLSPEGSLDFARLMLAANLHPTGMPPTPPRLGFPGLELDPLRWIVLADGVGCSGFGCTAVLPGGTNFTFAIPPGLGGYSILLQGFVRSSAPNRPRAAFVASEAHEIRIVE